MLRYMYCGEVDLDSSAEGVMVLAERYQMDELKQLCEEKLCSLVDKNNIAEMLYLADLYNCPFLKTAVVDVVRYILISYKILKNISNRWPLPGVIAVEIGEMRTLLLCCLK